jgi:dephospho-CoA kinase
MSEYPKLIGLTGYAGAGKDLVAALLKMVGYTRFGFADEMKLQLYDKLAEASLETKKALAERGICLVDE